MDDEWWCEGGMRGRVRRGKERSEKIKFCRAYDAGDCNID